MRSEWRYSNGGGGVREGKGWSLREEVNGG